MTNRDSRAPFQSDNDVDDYDETRAQSHRLSAASALHDVDATPTISAGVRQQSSFTSVCDKITNSASTAFFYMFLCRAYAVLFVIVTALPLIAESQESRPTNEAMTNARQTVGPRNVVTYPLFDTNHITAYTDNQDSASTRSELSPTGDTRHQTPGDRLTAAECRTRRSVTDAARSGRRRVTHARSIG